MIDRRIRRATLLTTFVLATAAVGCAPSDQGTIAVPGGPQRTYGPTTDPNAPDGGAAAGTPSDPGAGSTLEQSQ